MAETYRVLNGMKARGVRKSFSEEEIRKRTERLALARIEKARIVESKKREEAERKRMVKACAEVGVFVPV